MRTEEEIQAQLEHRLELLDEAYAENNDLLVNVLREQITALQWVLGIDQSKDIWM